ncbi:hypothetical protein F4808DRAFT_472660 [Astrocystis sublimbata]|nr:hypothetical protein F4808DRAFT_472660 [Astrocystis sublimbata]
MASTTVTLSSLDSGPETALQQQQTPGRLRWRPMPAPYAEDRSTPFAVVQTPDTPVPCRRCLQDSQIGEEMLLISYDPFLGDSPYRCASPIFVHSKACEPATFPSSGGELPEQLRKRVLSVRAYDAKHMMQACDVVDGDRLLETCQSMLADNNSAEYCHVHFARPGCFAVRIEKASLDACLDG